MRLTKLKKDEVANTTYIKLCVNKAHSGPVSEAKVARERADKLSAAAHKVKETAGFTVKVNTDDNSEVKTVTQNQSFVFKDLGDDSPVQVSTYAVLLMQAWDNIYISKGVGTPEYVKKLAETLEARATAYNKLGINPTSGERPILSADQRVIYNSIVGPTGFDYYEYHLAYKLAGQKKFDRSKTFRSLRPLDIKQILTKLGSEVSSLKRKYIITLKETN